MFIHNSKNKNYFYNIIIFWYSYYLFFIHSYFFTFFYLSRLSKPLECTNDKTAKTTWKELQHVKFFVYSNTAAIIFFCHCQNMKRYRVNRKRSRIPVSTMGIIFSFNIFIGRDDSGQKYLQFLKKLKNFSGQEILGSYFKWDTKTIHSCFTTIMRIFNCIRFWNRLKWTFFRFFANGQTCIRTYIFLKKR